MSNLLPYTFESFCKINGLDFSQFEKPPYSFSEFLKKHPHLIEGDFNPIVVYDGYVSSIKELGFKVYGNSSYGIGVKNE